jgi:hypothetical protein
MTKVVPGLLLLFGAASPVAAQFGAVGTRDLAFGAVIPGIVTTVTPTDPVKSGVYTVTAPVGTRLRLDFTLPTQLVRAGGGQMTVNFPNAYCILQETAPGSVPSTQNPKSMKPYTMTNGSQLKVYLGGDVTPTAGQATGLYTATVMLTVTIL